MFFLLHLSANVLKVHSECHPEMDYVIVLSDCVLVGWRKSSGCDSSSTINDFKFDVDLDNGTSYTFAVSINNVNQYRSEFEVAFSRHYCKDACLIRFEDDNSCWLFDRSILSTDYETGETNF